MEKTNVPYLEWPEWIKTLTAFYSKRFIVKNPKFIIGLSAVNITLGVLLFVQNYFFATNFDVPFERKMSFVMSFIAVINIVIGLFNLFFTYKYYTWILNNSSWEERFLVKSNGKHQRQYFLSYLALLVISAGITCLLCC